MHYPTIRLFGIQLTLCNSNQLLKAIEGVVGTNDKKLILSGNVHSFNLAYQHSWLRDFINQAYIVRIDGFGLRLGARLLGYETPPRMTWADFAWQLAEYSEPRGFRFFFLGARPGVADKAASRLTKQFPHLRIVGTQHGYFDKTQTSSENRAVIQHINATDPDILIVGLGTPLQERWLMENWGEIDANVALTGGAVFDYVSGELRRAPRWMTDYGLEWLGRLLIEPHRLWKRYIIGNTLFVWRIFMQKLRHLHH